MQSLKKYTSLVKSLSQNSNPNGIEIYKLNGSPEVDTNDFIELLDRFSIKFEKDFHDENTLHHKKAKILFKKIKQRQWSKQYFEQMLSNFEDSYPYPKWDYANFLKDDISPPKLYNQAWYESKLNEHLPQDFEVFMIEGSKYYCWKQDADKVNLEPYRPKKVERKIEPIKIKNKQPETKEQREKRQGDPMPIANRIKKAKQMIEENKENNGKET